MADTKALGIYDLTEPCTMTFRSLDKPRAFKRNGKEQGEPKFDGTFLFDPAGADWKALRAKAAAVARAKWPNRDLKELAFPFKSGDARIAALIEKAKKEGKTDYEAPAISKAEAGKGVLTARSKFRPNLAGLENGKPVDYEGEDAIAKALPKFYSGALVYATFNFVTYDGVRDGDKDGVNVYLNAVFTLNKGEKLGGGGGAANRFAGYVGSATEFDPTGVSGFDDDIPY